MLAMCIDVLCVCSRLVNMGRQMLYGKDAAAMYDEAAALQKVTLPHAPRSPYRALARSRMPARCGE